MDSVPSCAYPNNFSVQESSPDMNPAQQAFLGSVETCITALEQALAISKAREEETRKQLDLLIHGFKQLEELMYYQISQPSH